MHYHGCFMIQLNFNPCSCIVAAFRIFFLLGDQFRMSFVSIHKSINKMVKLILGEGQLSYHLPGAIKELSVIFTTTTKKNIQILQTHDLSIPASATKKRV